MSSSQSNNTHSSSEPTSIHSASIDEIYSIPMKDISRPLPSVLDEKKVLSLMETIQTMDTHLVPPIDVLWYEAPQSGNNYFFSMGGCHRWEAHKRLNSETIRAKLVRTTLNDLKMNEEKFHRDPEEYAIFKRLNNKQFSKRSNDVYVTRKTNFKAQLERCMKLISSNGNYREIAIHGMGSALERTINLALQFQLKTNCQLNTKIASIEVTDHLMPLLDDLEPMSDTRWVSAIHITCTLPAILTETK
ncbi:unnamed protein product [Rotaria socialis]|nr:unnamed protein product [Rotaria socialis]CAF4139929.1 unnamed protein product [Rotaria socialis]CAF4258378.1 unnamed protein product [Rotaria socialis]CAF4579229.1 unnamed protein product [Rotaria socialis]CAF4602913.1 unnamed protein product [Rotaria socialis]